jgi:hypothetical protein
MTVEKGDRYTYYAIIVDGHLLEIEPDAFGPPQNYAPKLFPDAQSALRDIKVLQHRRDSTRYEIATVSVTVEFIANPERHDVSKPDAEPRT